jgi:UDP-N-acetylmuramoyl-tripeptide--D-alanyl-D-alanine ligase
VAPLRVLGAVGKSTTRIMADAIVRSAADASTADQLPATVTVVHSLDEEARGALAAATDTDHIVVNADAIRVTDLPASVITVGLGASTAFRATDVDASLDGTAFTLEAHGEQHRVQLRLLGEHQVINALAAIAVASAYGIRPAAAIPALEALEGVGRGRMERLVALDNDILILNDTVSAGSLSVAAALKALAQIAGPRRSVAVLGAFPTPGEDPQPAHDRVGRLVVRLNIKKLVVVGQDARHIHNAAGLEGSWDGESVLVDSTGEAYDLLREELRQQDVVLVKSSPDAGLSELADRLAGVAR